MRFFQNFSNRATYVCAIGNTHIDKGKSYDYRLLLAQQICLLIIEMQFANQQLKIDANFKFAHRQRNLDYAIYNAISQFEMKHDTGNKGVLNTLCMHAFQIDPSTGETTSVEEYVDLEKVETFFIHSVKVQPHNTRNDIEGSKKACIYKSCVTLKEV